MNTQEILSNEANKEIISMIEDEFFLDLFIEIEKNEEEELNLTEEEKNFFSSEPFEGSVNNKVVVWGGASKRGYLHKASTKALSLEEIWFASFPQEKLRSLDVSESFLVRGSRWIQSFSAPRVLWG